LAAKVVKFFEVNNYIGKIFHRFRSKIAVKSLKQIVNETPQGGEP